MVKMLPFAMLIVALLAIGAMIYRQATLPEPASPGLIALPAGPPVQEHEGGSTVKVAEAEVGAVAPGGADASGAGTAPGGAGTGGATSAARGEPGSFTSLEQALKTPDQVLKLSINEDVGDLPRSIASFVNLRVLDLRFPLEQLPPEVAGFKKLEELTLYCTKVAELPEALATLPNLKSLSYGGDMECDHPVTLSAKSATVISNLTHLKELDLNFLTQLELSPEIGRLAGLEVLNLEYNDLQSLPKEIGKLKRLKVLRLGNNGLKTLPKEIAQLTSLERVELGNNAFPQLPAGLEKLPDLKVLDLTSHSDDAIRFSPDEKERVRKLMPKVDVRFSE